MTQPIASWEERINVSVVKPMGIAHVDAQTNLQNRHHINPLHPSDTFLTHDKCIGINGRLGCKVLIYWIPLQSTWDWFHNSNLYIEY